MKILARIPPCDDALASPVARGHTGRMRVAIVHELLTMKGGAERVAKLFCEMFPEAPIYTLLYDEQTLGDWFPRERVRASSKLTARSFNHHLHLNKFPAAVEAWSFDAFDLVLSSSSAFAHGIITNGSPKHLCYVHSPARYLWDRTHDVLDRAGRSPLGSLKRAYLERTFHRLRTWDAEAAARPDRLLAASAEVRRRIELYWDRESDVVHPPIEDMWFEDTKYKIQDTKNSFLLVSTLAAYKRIDRAIEACNQLRVPLKIVGTGAEEARLRNMAGPTIEFLGYRDHAALRSLYGHASALIIPGEEDFGLVAVESLACGTPVIAYGKGGVTETVTEGVTGAFFHEPTAASLAQVLQTHLNNDQKKYAIETCRTSAQKYRQSEFEHKIRSTIETMFT